MVKRKRVAPPSHQIDPRFCWASTTYGAPCGAKVSGVIPYCRRHLKHGDGAVKVVNHPNTCMGKILVARFKLPQKYRLLYWGKREPITSKNAKNDDRQIHFFLDGVRQYGCIMPGKFPGSVLQFASCPGPHELQTLATTSDHFGTRNSEMAARMYQLTRDVPANMQIAHPYGNEWCKLIYAFHASLIN